MLNTTDEYKFKMSRQIIVIIALGLFFSQEAALQQRVGSTAGGLGNRTLDSLALVDFFQSTQGALWKKTWDFSTPIDSWFGVHLNTEGRVACLDLDGDPNCTASRHGGNHLHGNLPDLQLPYLEHLFLSSNNIKGEIPDFSNLSHLLTLQLSANHFSGVIPRFEQTLKLQKIDLEYNRLKGLIPDLELPYLEALYLGHNALDGTVPSFEYAERLKQVYLEYNQLTACPTQFQKLRDLQQMILSHNKLSGELPSFKANGKMVLLDISDNQFEDCFRSADFDHIQKLKIDQDLLLPCSTYEVFLPTAFSPNGDGINDYFELGFAKMAPERVALQVWDIQKRLVYATEDYKNDWDGSLHGQGQVLPNGTYFYQLILDQTEKETGWLFLKQ